MKNTDITDGFSYYNHLLTDNWDGLSGDEKDEIMDMMEDSLLKKR